jgi:NAD-dependent dihydropyrimidine dehydrogenase PreA subunit
MPSDFDPMLARLGIKRLGNVAFAGTVRTDLLNGFRRLTYEREQCNGCRRCFEVCPLRVWEMDASKHALLAHLAACTACGACLAQCPTGAITAPRTTEASSRADR